MSNSLRLRSNSLALDSRGRLIYGPPCHTSDDSYFLVAHELEFTCKVAGYNFNSVPDQNGMYGDFYPHSAENFANFSIPVFLQLLDPYYSSGTRYILRFWPPVGTCAHTLWTTKVTQVVNQNLGRDTISVDEKVPVPVTFLGSVSANSIHRLGVQIYLGTSGAALEPLSSYFFSSQLPAGIPIITSGSNSGCITLSPASDFNALVNYANRVYSIGDLFFPFPHSGSALRGKLLDFNSSVLTSYHSGSGDNPISVSDSYPDSIDEYASASVHAPGDRYTLISYRNPITLLRSTSFAFASLSSSLADPVSGGWRLDLSDISLSANLLFAYKTSSLPHSNVASKPYNDLQGLLDWLGPYDQPLFDDVQWYLHPYQKEFHYPSSKICAANISGN